MCIPYTDVSQDISVGRLGSNVIPKHYDLKVTPDLKAFTYQGEQTITVALTEATSTIVLNSAEVEIGTASIVSRDGKHLVGQVSYDENNELATITFPSVIRKGNRKLALAFTGTLNDKLHGFYRSIYTDAKGGEHVIASTQMEPADARRAFPCFDEPAFKATWSVTLLVDEQLMAISNGRVIRTTRVAGGKKAVRAKKTIKMSSYLAAMVVGEFVASKTVLANGTKIRVIHVPGKENLTAFALEAAAFTIKWCEEYFGIRYPGDKLDLVGIPDFAYGAMENLGCMIFRETSLLIDPKTATIPELMRVFEVVAHEIVHSWFGDLVTMIWWNGLWLNEAFATYVSHKIMDAAKPEWNVFDFFTAGRRNSAMRVDGLVSTRPIESEVKRAADCLGMVDVITYGKGSASLWQLENFIGADAFRDGIRVYLKKHAYGNTRNSDLWDAIDGESDHPVREMMDSWILQPGHPLVTVSECSADGELRLRQERFLYGGSQPTVGTEAAAGTEAVADGTNRDWSQAGLWLIPVHLRYKTPSGVETKWVLLDQREKSFSLGQNVEWVVVNAGGTGFFRTRYASPLTAKVSVSELSVVERFHLVNDAWACVRAGLVSSTDYCEMIRGFSQETDPNIIGSIIDSLGSLLLVLPKENRPSFRAFIRGLFNPSLTRLGWQERADDSDQDKQLRGRLITTLGCIGEDKEVQKKARELFNQYLADKSSVSSDVVPALVWIAAATGDVADYDRLKALYETTAIPQEKVRFLSALASFRQEELLRKTLAASITSAVRTQDAPNLLDLLLESDIKAEVWKFVSANWEHIVAHFPERGVITVVSAFDSLDTVELEAEVHSFLASHPVRGGEKQVAQMFESLHLNVRFREREINRLTALFPVGSTQN